MYVITNRLKKFGISLTPQVDCNVNYVQELALIKLKPQSFTYSYLVPVVTSVFSSSCSPSEHQPVLRLPQIQFHLIQGYEREYLRISTSSKINETAGLTDQSQLMSSLRVSGVGRFNTIGIEKLHLSVAR